jgi:hypothetical protein
LSENGQLRGWGAIRHIFFLYNVTRVETRGRKHLKAECIIIIIFSAISVQHEHASPRGFPMVGSRARRELRNGFPLGPVSPTPPSGGTRRSPPEERETIVSQSVERFRERSYAPGPIELIRLRT